MQNGLYGLTDDEVSESLRKYGDNSLAAKKTKSLLAMFFGSFDFWMKVLVGTLAFQMIFALICYLVPSLGKQGSITEMIGVAVAIALGTGFSTVSEYRNTSRSSALQKEYSRTYCKVKRNGEIRSILTDKIVKGDIILLQAGDKVPTDGVIVSGSVKVSQAALNGESRDEFKIETNDVALHADTDDFDCRHKLFMGSVVTSGECYIKATVIGDASELGKINKSLSEDDEDGRKDTTSLKLEKVAMQIGKVGVTAAALAAVLNIILNMIHAEINAPNVFLILADAIMLFASIIIMAVPEGLPVVQNLISSMNTESMYKKNILVSHTSAFSDSAYVNLLFSDKTGTITEGRMSLLGFILGDGSFTSKLTYPDFIQSITVNNMAKVSSENTAVGSNNMDRALLTYAIFYADYKGDKPEIKEMSGFDSDKKCSTVTMPDGSVYWKGATENILDKITHYMDGDGNKHVFRSEYKTLVKEQMHTQTKNSMKLLSTAVIKDDEVILYAILCLRDGVRSDARQTVETLNEAGIQVVMVTGDAGETAEAIAKEAGILSSDDDISLTHEELEAMPDDELKDKLHRIRVVSRAKPMDKKRLVSVAQKTDNVCGMTGDGINDAPALKQADIGFAMGDGTAVAQEAGDVIILNNSLSAIKDCILNSRTMAKSVAKFLIFQLTVNVSTLLMNILAPILGWTEPFSITQILWINVIMDTLAAAAFAGEPILKRYMKEKPAHRNDPILTRYIKTAIGSSSLFITLGSILILENIGGIVNTMLPSGFHGDFGIYQKTFMFAFFIYAIIFNSLNTRSERFHLFEHIGENKRFIIVMGSVFILQTLILQFGGAVFGTTMLSAKALVSAMAFGACIIPFDLLRKAVLK